MSVNIFTVEPEPLTADVDADLFDYGDHVGIFAGDPKHMLVRMRLTDAEKLGEKLIRLANYRDD